MLSTHLIERRSPSVWRTVAPLGLGILLSLVCFAFAPPLRTGDAPVRMRLLRGVRTLACAQSLLLRSGVVERRRRERRTGVVERVRARARHGKLLLRIARDRARRLKTETSGSSVRCHRRSGGAVVHRVRGHLVHRAHRMQWAHEHARVVVNLRGVLLELRVEVLGERLQRLMLLSHERSLRPQEGDDQRDHGDGPADQGDQADPPVGAAQWTQEEGQARDHGQNGQVNCEEPIKGHHTAPATILALLVHQERLPSGNGVRRVALDRMRRQAVAGPREGLVPREEDPVVLLDAELLGGAALDAAAAAHRCAGGDLSQFVFPLIPERLQGARGLDLVGERLLLRVRVRACASLPARCRIPPSGVPLCRGCTSSSTGSGHLGAYTGPYLRRRLGVRYLHATFDFSVLPVKL